MGWPSRAFISHSLTHTPFPPRACIGGVASTRFPGLVKDGSEKVQWGENSRQGARGGHQGFGAVRGVGEHRVSK